jgi:hypothetical protein
VGRNKLNFKGKELLVGSLVTTGDGSLTLKHPSHGQDYHSSEGAFFESRELYIKSSSLVSTLGVSGESISILDVGLGLAYNAIVTIEAWVGSVDPCDMTIVSLECNRDLVELIASGEAPWMTGWPRELRDICSGLTSAAGQQFEFIFGHPRKPQRRCHWKILIGDALEAPATLKQFGSFHFIWQDPFSPEVNPTMWSAPWFSELRRLADDSCELLTYSVSRSVKDALEKGGWNWQRFPTPGKKRHWLKALPALK